MDKSISERVARLIANNKQSIISSYTVEKHIKGSKPLSDFHNWADGRPLHDAFLIRNSSGIAYWILFIEWNIKKGYYIVAYPEDQTGPLAEIHRVIKDRNRRYLSWSYKPIKQDERNEDRKKRFEKYFQDTNVEIAIPTKPDELLSFITELFTLLTNRIKADNLDNGHFSNIRKQKVNYWLTTHWPPSEDDPSNNVSGIYLPNGREQAGKDLFPGDRVLIYQSLTGRNIIKHDLNGKKYIVRSQKGRQGVVNIAEVTTKLLEDTNSDPETYTDGTSIWWRWYAQTRTISENGFVSLREVNRILDYLQDYNLRGFGDFKSGLKKLTELEYNKFVDIFKHNARSIPVVKKVLKSHRRSSAKNRGAGESDSHRFLKEYIAADPSSVLGEEGLTTLHVEYSFPTADRADIVLEDHVGRIIGLEVEVSVGPDQLEGILQAIKYRFMLALVKERKYTESRAFLVAYSLSSEIKEICREYDVEFFTVNVKDVEKWAKNNKKN